MFSGKGSTRQTRMRENRDKSDQELIASRELREEKGLPVSEIQETLDTKRAARSRTNKSRPTSDLRSLLASRRARGLPVKEILDELGSRR